MKKSLVAVLLLPQLAFAQTQGCFVEFSNPTQCYIGPATQCYQFLSVTNVYTLGSFVGDLCNNAWRNYEQAESNAFLAVQQAKLIRKLRKKCGNACRNVK